jgi:hypothetical protein
MAVQRIRFLENSDEHRRDILQDVFGLGPAKEFGMLFQLVRDLINNELATGRERVMGLLQQLPLHLDLENAEWDTGDDKVAGRNAAPAQLARQMGRIIIDHVNTRIIHELPFQVARKCRIEFKKQQLGIGMHSARNLAGMNADAGAVFGNDSSIFKINLVGDALDQRLRTWNDRRNLERSLQESFKKENTHWETPILNRWVRLVQSRLTRRPVLKVRVPPVETGLTTLKPTLDIDYEIYNATASEMSCPFSRELVIFSHA